VNDHLSARGAAAYCGVDDRTVRGWLASGRIAAEKTAGGYRIPRDQLEPFRRGGPHPTADHTAETAEDRGEGAAVGCGAWDGLLARELEEQRRMIERQQQTIMELSGQVGYFQAQLEQARDTIRALESPKVEVLTQSVPAAVEPSVEPTARPWWRRIWSD
jgi:excisionase family DNA binding protein